LAVVFDGENMNWADERRALTPYAEFQAEFAAR